MITSLSRSLPSLLSVVRLLCSIVRSGIVFGLIIWNSLRIEKVQRVFIQIIFDRYIGRKLFFIYDYLLSLFSFERLSAKRAIRAIGFLNEVVHGTAKPESLLVCIDFHVPTRASRNFLTFYFTNIYDSSRLS